ncbi:3-hydroxyacyl-ACP dehydratase FabZ [Streptomyces spongiicola]|uniref:3-hydroxyacyl-[acyl-carrier-protein] dehydratase n=1 Tax=Streptomyces spongiicola TaxID=1690221 RepID=A0A2S1YU04_9ACTN|nr:3-hydroxyacyl-ACP dehydratase FabZ [Streptomyces spongiicola]AWK07594.1 beta-hydroxyacyl-ACP dehydratase [Streptomyces spongiicola]GBQ02571.1 3-hydroxyacyl-ACP dehydratase FabZ [Streptomyces spongiicola]
MTAATAPPAGSGRRDAGTTGKRSYSCDDIKRMLPHRWPMLMIDRAYDVVPGVSGRGVKSVSVNEPYFAGHYPDHSVMPGVMIVESMAQLVAVVYVAEIIEAAGPDAGTAGTADAAQSVGYLGSISHMRFSRLVVPGDQLTLEATLGERLGALRRVSVSASVGRERVASGSLVVTSERRAARGVR